MKKKIVCVSYLTDSAGAVRGNMRRATTNFYPLEALSVLNPGYTVYSLNPVYFAEAQGIQARDERRDKWLSPIMQFMKANHPKDGAKEVQLAFIKSTGAKYLIVRSALLVPDYLMKGVVDSLKLATQPFGIYKWNNCRD